jgi:hypothetical protein
LELGNPNRGNRRRNEASESEELGLIHLAVIEDADKAENPGWSTERGQGKAVTATVIGAVLQSEQLVTGSIRVSEVGHAALGYHLSAELRERDPRVLFLKRSSGGGDEVETDLAVGANVCEQAFFADVSTLDNPDLAGWCTHLGCDLLGY